MATTGAEARPAPVETLWQRGHDRIDIIPCPIGGGQSLSTCRALRLKSATGTQAYGGYVEVKRLWARKPGQSGPDVFIMGDGGGSGGNGDLIAITFAAHPIIRVISGERMDSATVTSVGTHPRINLPFTVSGFNGAAHAADTVVFLPLTWSKGNFVLDRRALAARTVSGDELSFRQTAVDYELARWASDSYPATSFYPIKTTTGTPVSTAALAELMLYGHVGTARQILDKAWPKAPAISNAAVPMGGEEQFWSSLCKLIVSNAHWQRFQLDRLPGGDRIEAAANSRRS